VRYLIEAKVRFLFEVAVFAAIFGMALAVGACALWLAGSPLGLGFTHAMYFAWIGLVFLFPAAANIWIMFRGSGGENPVLRLLAGIRGFGMLLCAVAVAGPLVCVGAAFRPLATVFVIGSVLWWGSLPFEDRINRRRLRHLAQPGGGAEEGQ
jgi:hypothetical protein